MKGIINQITVVCQQGVSTTTIGDKISDMVVSEIKNQSNLKDSIYVVYDEVGNVIREIINCPVEITHKIVDC